MPPEDTPPRKKRAKAASQPPSARAEESVPSTLPARELPVSAAQPTADEGALNAFPGQLFAAARRDAPAWGDHRPNPAHFGPGDPSNLMGTPGPSFAAFTGTYPLLPPAFHAAPAALAGVVAPTAVSATVPLGPPADIPRAPSGSWRAVRSKPYTVGGRLAVPSPTPRRPTTYPPPKVPGLTITGDDSDGVKSLLSLERALKPFVDASSAPGTGSSQSGPAGSAPGPFVAGASLTDGLPPNFPRATVKFHLAQVLTALRAAESAAQAERAARQLVEADLREAIHHAKSLSAYLDLSGGAVDRSAEAVTAALSSVSSTRGEIEGMQRSLKRRWAEVANIETHLARAATEFQDDDDDVVDDGDDDDDGHGDERGGHRA